MKARHLLIAATLWIALFELAGCVPDPGQPSANAEQAFYIPLCTPNTFDPYAGSMPGAQGSPTVGAQLPQQYKCSWYPDPVTFGPMNVSLYVSECTAPPTPAGSVDVWDGFNVHQGKCARITAPTHNGTWVYRPYFDFLANGWRSRVWSDAPPAGYRETSIHSIEIGPHTHVKFSSAARVDLTNNWACYNNGKCRDLDNQAAWSLEADHFHLWSGAEAGWAPWSMMISAVY